MTPPLTPPALSAAPTGPIDPPAPEPEAAAPGDGAPPPIVLRRLGWRDPLRWLALGWRDLWCCPAIGLFYGACFALMGWALEAAFAHAPAYVLALSAGFLLMGPFMGLGLYRASQRIEQGQKPGFADSLFAWESHLGQLGIFGFVLLVLEMLWGRATLILFAVSFQGMPDFKGSLLALLDPDNLGFTAGWVAVGAVFAGLIYAISVVAIPMLMHRKTDAITAAITSLRLVFTQTPVMLFWGALIALIVGVSMLPWFAGIIVAGPLIGHASWHAYRAAVAD
jgi:uncharacterized membrane protein